MRYVSVFMLSVQVLVLAILGSGCPPVTLGVGSILVQEPASGLLDFGTDLDELTLGVSLSFGSDASYPIQVTASAPWLIPGDCQNFADNCRSTGPQDILNIPITVDRSLLAYGLNEGSLVVSSGNMPTKRIRAQVIDTLTADFGVSTTIPYINDPVTFSDLSLVYPGGDPILSYAWDFGDGATSTLMNPQHTYTNPGAYTVSLVVQTASGTDTVVKESYINARVMRLDVDFSGTPRSIQERGSVQFTNLSPTAGLSGVSYSWDFGDGTLSHVENPLHQYMDSGLYRVSLTITTDFGTSSEAKDSYILVTSVLTPTANFLVEPTQAQIGDNVHFFDLSEAGSSPITQWVWSFGDGSGSTDRNPVYAYSEPGSYDVSLTVISPDGNDTISKSIDVAHRPADVDFELSHWLVRPNEDVRFTNLTVPGSLPIDSLEWRFGDGTTSTEEDPIHAYTFSGWNTVELSIQSASGDVTEQKVDHIFVLDEGSPVIITEFVASNRSGLLDVDGQTSDWIELYNASDDTVSLLGWALTDDEAIPDKWLLPDVSIEPAGFLVVFASGKDRSVVPGELHTNFKLDADGEYLALIQDPTIPTIVAYSYPGTEQRRDVSYGLYDDTLNVFMEVPTPGAPNAYDSARLAEATPPILSHPHGHYADAFDLELTGTEAGAEIYYTLDGSKPDQADGILYEAAITVAENTVIRAIAYAPDYLPSKVTTATYIIGASAQERALPALCVVGDPEKDLWGPDGIMVVNGGYYDGDGDWLPYSEADSNSFLEHGSDWERLISLEFFDPNAAPGSEAAIGFQDNCGIRIHGSAYRRSGYKVAPSMDDPWELYAFKKSFRYYFRDEYGNARLTYPLIPNGNLDSIKNVVMRAGTDDHLNPFVKDELSRRLMRDMGNLTSAGGLIHFYLNGHFKGYYNPVERYTEDFFQRAYGSSNGWDIAKGTDDAASQRRELVEGDWDAYTAMYNFAYSNDLSNPTHYATLQTMLDVDNFIDYLILELYGANFDWPRNNWYMARERSADPILSRWRYYIWDMEMCYYAMTDSGEDFTLDSVIDNPFHLRDGWTFLDMQLDPRGDAAHRDQSAVALLYQALKVNPDFRASWAARADVLLNGGALDTENVQLQFQALYDEVNTVLHNQPMNTYIRDTWATHRPAWLLYWFGMEGLSPVVPMPPAP